MQHNQDRLEGSDPGENKAIGVGADELLETPGERTVRPTFKAVAVEVGAARKEPCSRFRRSGSSLPRKPDWLDPLITSPLLSGSQFLHSSVKWVEIGH